MQVARQELLPPPFAYMGNKRRLLPQLLPLIPPVTGRFVDLFAGTGSVAVNVQARHKIVNDSDPYLAGLLRAIRDTSPEDFIRRVHGFIGEYGLDVPDESRFYALRDRYNTDHNPIVLYTLLLFAVNGLFRFNSRGEYNAPKAPWKCRYVSKIGHLPSYHQALRQVRVTSLDYRNIRLDMLTSQDYVYLDPPYENTTAPYNNAWSIKDADQVRDLADWLDRHNIGFGYSNLLAGKNQTNVCLKTWIETHNSYTMYRLEKNYRNCFKTRKTYLADQEVYVTNRPPHGDI
ncbi:Dam family site-specific DNA-(adenine-N6)-methyltransferase [Mobiluncus curtisii]|uniref:Dam family site-specific DNA-(adenine-N6)-methyltransferase n=1 Tax=Mobiluncus curtisii TaxID=2051 RepID=UPI0021E209E9|nr:Dam family site-specific DNA-(adenine-N6)-methyltransferase [Mobiluncus curtisii]MCU9986643.1 Dam family site-specific DNA-(adenine-N6)-methyltransferase [Mobiluncus curtisii]